MVKDAPLEAQLMSLAEDAGLIKMINGPGGTECVWNHMMVIPDWASNAIVAFTVVLWLLQANIV